VAKKIDEIIFTKIREKIKEYNLNKDSSGSLSKKQAIGEVEKESLISDMEEHANTFSEESVNNDVSFSEVLEENKTVENRKKAVDPYREII
jgi:hypothetical protein